MLKSYKITYRSHLLGNAYTMAGTIKANSEGYAMRSALTKLMDNASYPVEISATEVLAVDKVLTIEKALPDARYVVELEHCGHATMRHVARFCGEWIDQRTTRNSAVQACIEHNDKRTAATGAKS